GRRPVRGGDAGGHWSRADRGAPPVRRAGAAGVLPECRRLRNLVPDLPLWRRGPPEGGARGTPRCRGSEPDGPRSLRDAPPLIARLAAGADLDRRQRVDRPVVQPGDLPVLTVEPQVPGPAPHARLLLHPHLAGAGAHRARLRGWPPR